jgi:hypothetical protein
LVVVVVQKDALHFQEIPIKLVVVCRNLRKQVKELQSEPTICTIEDQVNVIDAADGVRRALTHCFGHVGLELRCEYAANIQLFFTQLVLLCFVNVAKILATKSVTSVLVLDFQRNLCQIFVLHGIRVVGALLATQKTRQAIQQILLGGINNVLAESFEQASFDALIVAISKVHGIEAMIQCVDGTQHFALRTTARLNLSQCFWKHGITLIVQHWTHIDLLEFERCLQTVHHGWLSRVDITTL